MNASLEGWIERPVIDCFREQVARDPDALALSTSGLRQTYGDLDARAGTIASAIVRLTGEQKEPVALFVSNYTSLIPAILGVLESGKFYVTIDPQYPPARIRQIVEDCGTRLLLCDRATHAAALLEAAAGACSILDLDEVEARDRDRLLVRSSAADLAYIVYTSGSTGKPKGVMQTQRNLLHNMRHYIARIGLGPADRMTFLFSPSFAGAVSDIFGALLSGASIHPFAVREKSLRGLTSWLRSESLTVYHSVPTLFRHLMAMLSPREQFPDVRIVKFGGEPVSQNDIELYRRHFPDSCRLHLALTATETNFVCDLVADKSWRPEGHLVPLGAPIEGKTVTIVDEHGDPVASGEPGEIAVRSRFLSSGYWNQPEATAAAFVRAGDSDERVYRMGDIGSFLPDGNLVHLGRLDGQVKIRGHRIELTEVEMALQSCPAVREAAVSARANHLGDLQLIAWVVLNQGFEDLQALRTALRGRIPEAMIPARFAVLDRLPANPNGKVDRSALETLEIPTQPIEDEEPWTEIERRLLTIWIGVGGDPRTRRADEIFETGGDSLAIIHFFARVESECAVRLPLTELMRRLSLERLGAILDGREMIEESRVVAFRESGTRVPLFAVPGFDGNALGLRRLSEVVASDQPIFALQYPGVTGVSGTPLNSVEEIAGDFVRIMRSVQPAGPYAILGSSFGGLVAFEMGCQLERAGEVVAFLGMIDTRGVATEILPPWRRKEGDAKGAEHRPFAKRLISYARRVLGKPWRASKSLMKRLLERSGRQLPDSLANLAFVNRFAAERYRPGVFPRQLTLFRALQGMTLTTGDPLLGWEGTAHTLTVVDVPGTHRTMAQAGNVEVLAAAIENAIHSAMSQLERRRPEAAVVPNESQHAAG